MQNTNTPSTNAQTWLTTLCILSLVAVGLTMLYDVALLLIKSTPSDVLQQAMQQSKDNIEQWGVADASAVDFGMMYKMIDNGQFHFLFNCIELVGLVLLMKKNEIGKHFYFASQIGFAYLSYITFQQAATMQILLCLIWSWLFWRTTKRALQ